MSGLTPEERAELADAVAFGPGVTWPTTLAVERIVAAREADAAEQARAEAWDEGYDYVFNGLPFRRPKHNPYRAALATEPTPYDPHGGAKHRDYEEN